MDLVTPRKTSVICKRVGVRDCCTGWEGGQRGSNVSAKPLYLHYPGCHCVLICSPPYHLIPQQSSLLVVVLHFLQYTGSTASGRVEAVYSSVYKCPDTDMDRERLI